MKEFGGNVTFPALPWRRHATFLARFGDLVIRVVYYWGLPGNLVGCCHTTPFNHPIYSSKHKQQNSWVTWPVKRR